MGTAFLHGNGSGFNLNFSFKNYEDRTSLLADTPNENTIGIVSSVSVPRWRITSVTSPSSTSPEGYVYLNASVDGDNRYSTTIPTFDPINRNNNMILLRLKGCKQIISGSWEDVEAYIYKKSTWVQFADVSTLYTVFDGGSTVDYTGGWSGTGNTGDTLDVTFGASSGWLSARNLYSTAAIAMAKYSTLHFTVSAYNYPGTVGIGTTADGSTFDKSVSVSKTGEYTLDISGVTADSYVKMLSEGKQSADSTNYEAIGFKVSKIWME